MFNALNMLSEGGWIMAALAVCSVVALTIVIERAMALRRAQVVDPRVTDALDAFRGEETAGETLVACQRARGPFARIMAEVIKSRHLDHHQAIESMHAVGRTQAGRLERGLTVLEIIAATSPLLGLLGTVLGMVDVFNAITVEGLGNPRILSGGISKALITTVAGLSVAIPALAFHSLFSKRVDEYAIEMQDRATAFLIRLQQER